MEIYDVIVIGAGPAGCSSALHSAKNGLKTLLLEEHQIIGQPVHCGECLSGLSAGRLGLELPEKVISKTVKGIRIIFPNGKSSFVREEGFVLEKDKFEQWLAEKAQEKGAEIELNCRVEEIKREKEWMIKCSDSKEFKGKILIDATGVNSLTSKKLNLNPAPKTVIGIQYRMKEIPEDGFLDFYLWPKLALEGYLWMIPKKGNKANVGLVTEEKIKAKVFLDEFIKKKKWETKEIEKSFGGLIPISGPHKNTVRDGLILVGDAAGFASPMFEGGTSLALTSGKFAADTALKAVKKNDFTKEVLKEYEELWKKEFPDYTKLIKGKNALYKLSEEELNCIAEVMPNNISEISFFERILTGLKLFIKKPFLFGKGIDSAAKAFGYSRAKYYGW